MEVFYKFKIGTEVKIVKENSTNVYYSYRHKGEMLGKTTKIISRGFTYEKERIAGEWKFILKPFYYIEQEEYFTCYMWYEDSFECVNQDDCGETVNYDIKTEDGVELNIGDTFLVDIIHRDGESYVANTSFTFSGESILMGIRCNYELNSVSILYNKIDEGENKIIELLGSRQFLCYHSPEKEGDVPHPCGDARMFGYNSWHRCDSSIFKNLPKDYPEIFINTCLGSNTFYSTDYPLGRSYGDQWEIKQWLDRFGVYEEVEKLWKIKYKAKIEKQNKEKSEKLRNKISSILKTLSDEEKKELLKQLTEKQTEK